MKPIQKRIIQLLTEGNNQTEISNILKKNNEKPYSHSSVEKYIRQIKDDLGIKTIFQLGYYFGKKEGKKARKDA